MNSRFRSLFLLPAALCVLPAVGALPPFPSIPGNPETDLHSFSDRLEALEPGDSPLRTHANASSMLHKLEQWRESFDGSRPPGWREKLKTFSIQCDRFDRNLRRQLSRNEVTPEEIESWDRFYSDSALPSYRADGPLMLRYREMMQRYRNAAQFWKTVQRETEI